MCESAPLSCVDGVTLLKKVRIPSADVSLVVTAGFSTLISVFSAVFVALGVLELFCRSRVVPVAFLYFSSASFFNSSYQISVNDKNKITRAKSLHSFKPVSGKLGYIF